MPTPETLFPTVRDHWAVENALHWQLDVSLREDAARNRKDNAAGNIAVLRRRALDVVRRDPSNTSLSIKLKRAGWDDKFLHQILINISVIQAKSDCPVCDRRTLSNLPVEINDPSVPDDLAHALAGINPFNHLSPFRSYCAASCCGASIAASSPNVTGFSGGRIRKYPVSSVLCPVAVARSVVTVNPQ